MTTIDPGSPTSRVLKFACADGVNLAADAAGDSQAPAVILLHGGGQTRHSWDGAMRAMLARGYRVINVDARGHGDSDWSKDGNYSLNVLADDLRRIIDSLPSPPALVGASMGGMTALLAVAREPRAIAKALVLVDIVPQVEPEGVARIVKFFRGNPSGFATLEEAAAAVSAYNPHRPRPRDISGLMKNLRRRADGRLYWHWDPIFFNGEKSLEPPLNAGERFLRYRHVQLPVLLVRGLRSDLISGAGVEAFRRDVPQLEVFDVEGAGHMVVGDRNDVFNAGILNFLQRHLPV
jgi:pimeloyl-ACP methyl ester carboxylesterase